MKKKTWLKGAAIVLSAAAIGTAVAGGHFYNMAVKRSRKKFMTNNPDLAGVGETFSGEINWVDAHGYTDVELKSHDGLRLHGVYIPAEQPTNRTAILAHGYTSTGRYMASFAKFYHEWGFNVLLPDARGHGESEGNYIGFGWHDRLDYLRWIDCAVNLVGEEAQIVLHGISMGGATVLMTAGESLPPQVKAIVSDCAYSSVHEQLVYQMKRMYKLPSFPIMNATSLITKLRVGYSFEEASAVKQVSKAKVPILFIHGDNDTFVPYQMVHQLYEACPAEKQLLVVPGAGHGTAFSRDRDGYQRAVKHFVDAYIQ